MNIIVGTKFFGIKVKGEIENGDKRREGMSL